MKKRLALILALLCLGLCACGAATPQNEAVPAQSGEAAADSAQSAAPAAEQTAQETPDAQSAEPAAAAVDDQSAALPEPYEPDTKIWDVINDPAFDGFGRLLFPEFDIAENLPLKEVYMLLPSYHNIKAEKTAEVLTALRDWSLEGRQIFFDLYTDEEKAADPAKEATGLFFFPGEPGAKTVIYCPGQAFKYIGAVHDGFPHALELSKMGYNALVLIYRPGAVTGCEDLSRAIAFMYDHADQLQLDTADYSLWGGASGGRLPVWICEYGTAAFGEESYPKPAAVVMQYCAVWNWSTEDVPTYVNVGKRDTFTIVNVPGRVAQLEGMGIDTELEIFDDCLHGFGLGLGTSAEGWIYRAVSFWERHMSA